MGRIERSVMKKACFLTLAGASVFLSFCAQAQFGSSVAGYTAGSGVTAGYNDPTHALGAPTTYIGYQNADPFNPAYQAEHLVSIGAGGSLTVPFGSPIQNNPDNPYGLAFLIFGNAGFVITNGDFSGGGRTDGTLFANNPGETRVWVSADGVTFYQLNSSLAPVADGMFPTDANGNPQLPVNPALGPGNFVGADLAGIRSLYNGSGGGTGYDISWALDASGQSVFLPSVDYVRIDVLSGKADIDALSVVVPEPGTGALMSAGVGIFFWCRRRRS